MKRIKSQKEYEQYLNQLYWDTYNLSQSQEMFGHYFSPGRAWEAITTYYFKQKLGTLQRKKDPIAFYAGYNDWNTSKQRTNA